MNNVITKLEEITPRLANRYLKHNIAHNRPVNRRHVLALVAAIKKGHWRVNGDTVVFSEEGNLLDGQHRLHAVLEAKTPIDSLVVRGVDERTFTTMDTGKRRSAGDTLGASGVKNANATAAVLRLIHVSGRMDPKWNGTTALATEKRLDNDDMLALSNEYPDVCDLFSGVLPNGSFMSTHVRRTSAAFALYWMQKKSYTEANIFYNQVNGGADLAVGSPALTLRDRLIRVRGSRFTRLSTTEELEYIFRAWNALREGRTLKNLKQHAKGIFPTPQ